jgi:enediyne biosynthesis protein E4
MATSRRLFLQTLLGGLAARSLGQGIVEHQGVVRPRSKPSGRPFPVRLVDVSATAGLKQATVWGSSSHHDYIVEAIGCGCAFIDYDNDEWMDLFVLSGNTFGAGTPAASNRLYHNNRDGTFTDVTVKAGLVHNGWSCGVCVGDYNNDGFEDIFVSGWGQNLLYRNNGDGTFTDVTKQAGLGNSQHRWSTGCSFVDYNRDGHLDLFVSSYLEFDLAHAPLPGSSPLCMFRGVGVNCGPRGFKHGSTNVYRNNGDGTFSDVSAMAGVAVASDSYCLTVVAADFDDDGWPDIYVACDSTPSLLFMNNRDGTFREEATLRGVAYSNDGQEQAGMGVAVADASGQGHLDMFKTNFAGDVPNFYRNAGKGQFEDLCIEAGLAVDNRFVCWGAGFADFDNDGAPDLFAVTGHVYPEIGKRYPELAECGPRLLFRNLGDGKFEEMLEGAGPAMTALHSSRGCAFGDFDNDGDLDVLIVNLHEPPSLLRNDLGANNRWLKVRLRGTMSNRSAIGARVVVTGQGLRPQAQEVQSQSSFLSCNDPRLHFGTGSAEQVDVRVRWPSGKWDVQRTLRTNQIVSLVEGQA